jgi:hypothetical protein
VKSIVRLIIVLSLFGIIASTVLLLNFTAPNPTGRRYSSTAPLTTGQGSSSAIGLTAENILAKDLGLPRNDEPEQLQCICKNAATVIPNECRTCFAYVDVLSTSSHRRPDFVGKGFIAESKNRRNLLYEYTDQVDQISDYAVAAKLLNQPLWVFVRVNTTLSPEFRQIVESIGGGVVSYFKDSNYTDPIDSAAQKTLIASSSILALAIIGLAASRRFKNRLIVVSSPSSKPPSSPKPSGDPVSKAMRKTDNAEDFMQRSKEKRRQDIEIEDSRDDLL